MKELLHQANTHLAIYFSEAPGKPDSIAPPGSDKFLTIVSWIGWGATLGAIVALIIAGVRFGFQKSHGTASNEEAGKVAWTLVGCVLIAVSGSLVGALAG
ncbi:hypothetical protein [Nocardia sp. 348MFTsu5.1]|uniref:hypothetical protein n=1 Tax=Nocardia sp. 348MFTsu5.1 TaxID=1172185 RepID=UPI0003673A9B|nr:hypothetical protein [Nocardia sp. 348MFTsu5.1]